ncbi:MAG: C4-dicarboxylate ABC transporter substrate-binding protein, partial [Pseudomonadota bacterium]|nr:C4-dicarboxylate ABC transporter substrate-binding protein [Pseudomonadota bacterium]
FAMRRGHLDSSGLKSAGDWLAESTGIAALEWVGKVGTWQYAIAIGGALFAVAAALRLAARLRTFKGAN